MESVIDHSSSEERMREIAGIVFDEKIPRHKLGCMEPGGQIHELSEKISKGNSIQNKMIGAVIVLSFLSPFAIGLWTSMRSDANNKLADVRLEKQIAIAAEVAQQLKAVQDAAKNAATMPGRNW